MTNPKTVSDVFATIGKNDRLVTASDLNMLVVYGSDPDHRNMRILKNVYRYDNANKIIESIPIDKTIDELVDVLAAKLDIKEFLRQRLNDESVCEILEIAKIFKDHPEAKEQVTTRRGCLYFDIPNPAPGGDPMRLYLKGLP